MWIDGEALITIHVEPEAKAKLSGVPVGLVFPDWFTCSWLCSES
jgi:hypothetical protein